MALGEVLRGRRAREPAKASDEVKTVLGVLAFIGRRKQKTKGTVNADNKNAHDNPDILRELAMDSWEEEMSAIASKAKAKSKNMVKKTKPTGPDLRFPLNWARFPTHSRHERSLSAGRPDNIQAKDFGSEECWE